MKMRAIIAATMAAAALLSSGSAYAQTKYFARERLTAGPSSGSNTTAPPAQTYKATCGTKQGGKWASNYQAREAAGKYTSLGNDGTDTSGVTATALCKAHVEKTGKTGVCSTNYTVFFYEGDTSLETTFASNYSIVCTATPN